MNCEQVTAQVADYAAGFLAEASRVALEAHLASCGECRRQLEELRALDRLVVADRVAAPRTLALRVMNRLRPAARPKHAWAYMLDGLGPILAAIVILPALILLGLRYAPALSRGNASLDLTSLLTHPSTAPALLVSLVGVAALFLWLAKRVADALAQA